MICDNTSYKHIIQELYNRVTSHTAAVWARDLVHKLLLCLNYDPATQHTPVLDFDTLAKSFKSAKRRLVMLDYGKLS